MADFTLDTGAANVSLDGITRGISQGDVGFSFGLVARANRMIEGNWLGVQIDITGAPTGVQVDIQGSLDDKTYYKIIGYPYNTGGLYFIGNIAVRFVKAVLTTLNGGSSPTVKVQFVQ